MSNRVQERPSSSNCIISIGESHGITFKILGRVSVQQSPRKAKKFKEHCSHSDLKTVKIGRNYPVHKFYSRYWKNQEKNTLDIPVFNYPVFLILYLLFFSYFSRNAFHCLCQEATNIIQESYMTNDQAIHQQNWNWYREAAQNSIFQKKVLELFGENEDDDGNYIYKYSTIEECKLFQIHLHGSQRI